MVLYIINIILFAFLSVVYSYENEYGIAFLMGLCSVLQMAILHQHVAATRR